VDFDFVAAAATTNISSSIALSISPEMLVVAAAAVTMVLLLLLLVVVAVVVALQVQGDRYKTEPMFRLENFLNREKANESCEISSSHGGEYEAQNLLG
jgi:hypothetical protein